MTVVNCRDISLVTTCFRNKQTIVNVDCNYVPWESDNMYQAFYNCGSLQSVNNINENVNCMLFAFTNCTNMVDAPIIPNSVTNIAQTFETCIKLENVPTLPNNVNSLYRTFWDCRSLVNIPEIPNSVTNMYGTFYNCKNLVNAPVIPNGVTNMRDTFLYTNISYIPEIPNSVIDMRGTFMGCRLIQNVYQIDVPSCTNMNQTFYQCYNLTDINIYAPNCIDVTNIFAYCNHLKNVQVEFNKVENISNLFNACYNLKSVDISAQNATNATNMFQECWNLTSISWNMPNCVDLTRTFYRCSSLENAPEIPNGVTQMPSTFGSCIKLKNAPIIPNSVSILYATFDSCFNLIETPYLPPSVTTIQQCFDRCWDLQIINNLPPNLSSMRFSFIACYKITSVPNIPSSVTDMCQTFKDCINLTGNIYIQSNQITDALNCFNNTSLQKNVFIPFEYENGVATQTYNSFITAGYDTLGTKDNVYLKDIDGSKITINATPNDATILMCNETNGWEEDEDDLNKFIYTNTNNDILINGLNTADTNIVIPTKWTVTNGMRALEDETIGYKVYKEGYSEVSNSVIVSGSETINVTLEPTMCTYTIRPLPTDASITINGETRNTVTVPYGTEVSYTVSKTHYGTVTGTETVKASFDKFIQLPIDQHTFTINATPDDAEIQILINGKLVNQNDDNWVLYANNLNGDVELQEYIGSDTDIVMPTTFTTNNTITADYGTEISWKVSKEGYADKAWTIILDNNVSINVNLGDSVNIDDYTYTVNNGVLTLTKYNGSGGNIEAPQIVEEE